ncbi:hypothetical protein [Nocardia sp. NPDC004722]
MKSLVVKACAVAALTTGLAAAPAMADPLVLQPAAPESVDATPIAGLVPLTGSAGLSNSLTCALKTFSASMPCLLT